MSNPAPCRCDAPNLECHRAGIGMMKPLWELCRGISCSAEMSARYRANWDAQSKAAAPVSADRQARDWPCVHEGAVVDFCPSCPGAQAELRHVRDCDLHEQCTRGRVPMPVVPSCVDCLDYQPDIPPPPLPTDDNPFPTRHLLYHLLPVHGNGRWQQNVRQVLDWLPLFTGRKICALMVDAGRDYTPIMGTVHPDSARVPLVLDPPEAAEPTLRHHGFEVIRVPNDPNLREVASHGPLFERLKELAAPGDVALWAHAKGVTRHHGHPAKRWTDVLAEVMLGHWPAVAEVLRRHPVAGCFKKMGPGWHPDQSTSDWHYSGSWFWFRCADLFSRDWLRIDQFWSGIEPYPSQLFHFDEAGTVFYQGRVPNVNLYSMRFWDKVIHPAFMRWKEEHAHQRTVLPERGVKRA